MQKDINFISSQTQRKIKIASTLQSVMYLVFFLFGLTLLVYLATLPLLMSMRLKNNKADGYITSIKTKIDNYRQLESTLQTAKSRSKIAAKVSNSTNESVTKYLDMVILLYQNGYRLKSNLGEVKTGSEIEVEKIFSDTVSMANLTIFMEDLKTKKFVSNYSVDSITRQIDGEFLATVILNKKTY